eukprot:Lankesteria_metandrocarpae@DN7681_c0_g1_i1.p1
MSTPRTFSLEIEEEDDENVLAEIREKRSAAAVAEEADITDDDRLQDTLSDDLADYEEWNPSIDNGTTASPVNGANENVDHNAPHTTAAAFSDSSSTPGRSPASRKSTPESRTPSATIVTATRGEATTSLSSDEVCSDGGTGADASPQLHDSPAVLESPHAFQEGQREQPLVDPAVDTDSNEDDSPTALSAEEDFDDVVGEEVLADDDLEAMDAAD